MSLSSVWRNTSAPEAPQVVSHTLPPQLLIVGLLDYAHILSQVLNPISTEWVATVPEALGRFSKGDFTHLVVTQLALLQTLDSTLQVKLSTLQEQKKLIVIPLNAIQPEL